MLAKLLEKKKREGKMMSPMEADAKMSMLQALKDEMGDGMKDDLMAHKMNKVEIAAPDKEGLEEGLDTAKDVIDTGEPTFGDGKEATPMEDEKGDDEEVEMHMGNYLADPSPENLDKLREFLEKKKSMMGS